ncbi:MAG: N-(5'-phosphoribosyl)anthranilate isomerase [Candidatus Omnitrophota bacterium]|nr:MAG: N-(5'-phosphoribosyl)anthranilate isomerase [Candidatus Omnitrophota bacterium]RKY46019.1 MAG: N-(5'-phosphoribosyl)anthranilate isomerase [Candidatus Omnitrophota bacterium]HDN86280.1 phosphoribosylanthranilate isomerase [Candidatus Omnitrophota bacterium]
MVKVKICGITNLEDALVCSQLGADALGFIFSKVSPRYISPLKAKQIVRKLDPFITKVGVFVNEDRAQVLKIAKEVGLDVLQFHGRESARFCKFFLPHFKVIKAIFPQEIPSLNLESIVKFGVDGYLFDVSWHKKLEGERKLKKGIIKKLAKFTSKISLILSGGLNPRNIEDILKIIRPYAVDVASGVESIVGKKDMEKVREFIKKVKLYEATR